MSTNNLIENLTQLMREHGTNPRRLADQAGLNPTGVHDILNGKSRNPRRDTLEKLARALNVTVEGLLTSRYASADEERLILAFRQLSPQERRRFLAFLEVAVDDVKATLDGEARSEDS